MSTRSISEKRTRKDMIDPQLERAGWYLRDHSKVKIEIPVDGYDAEPWNGVTDYCLYRENGEVLAVVEAKKTVVDVRLAEAQLEYYVREIEKHQSFRPFGFLVNGYDIYFVEVGYTSKRLVNGFFTREDLENQLFIRQNGKSLGAIEINNTIVDRAYQHEAIRRVSEEFNKGKRKALLVMATGTGRRAQLWG
jgi:type I site-specific restriction endonuclease